MPVAERVKFDLRNTMEHTDFNPRQLQSYAIDEMAYEIALHDFRLLNEPILLEPDERIRKRFNVPDGFAIPLQGSRRCAGIKAICENPDKYNYKDDVDLLANQYVKLYKGLTEDEARTIAFDEKSHVGLKQYECVLEMLRMFKACRDISDVALRCGKIICETRMIGKGPKVWSDYTDNRPRKEREKDLISGVRNVVNHVYYAFCLGPAIAEEVVNFFKYNKDGIKANGEVIIFDAKWTNVNKLYSAALQKGKEKAGVFVEDYEPIEKIILSEDHKKIDDIIGGCPSVEVVLNQLVAEKYGDIPTVKGLTQKQKEAFVTTAGSNGVKAFAQMIAKNAPSDAWREHDDKYKQLEAKEKALKALLDKLTKDRQELVRAIFDEPSPRKTAEIFLTPPNKKPVKITEEDWKALSK